MFCTAHHAPRPIPVPVEVPRAQHRRPAAPRRVERLAPGQIFTDWASI